MTTCLAIDPDTHNTGLVIVEKNVGQSPRFLLARVIRVHDKYKKAPAVLEMCKALWCAMGPTVQEVGVKIDLIVVEGQRIYTEEADEGVTRNPTSVLMCAQVAGAAIASAMAFAVQPNVRFPYPSEWKGSTGKIASQSRAFRAMSMPYAVRNASSPYCFPTAPGMSGLSRGYMDEVPQAAWKHVADALALALWGLEKTENEAQRAVRAADKELNNVLGRRGSV